MAPVTACFFFRKGVQLNLWVRVIFIAKSDQEDEAREGGEETARRQASVGMGVGEPEGTLGTRSEDILSQRNNRFHSKTIEKDICDDLFCFGGFFFLGGGG